jgi:hypothetical protein
MQSNRWFLSAIASTLLLGSLAHADELKMTNAPQEMDKSGANQPARGMSMDKVEAAFGAPANRVAAVGNPPITRWEYPGFVVFFENNIVLHSVVKL